MRRRSDAAVVALGLALAASAARAAPPRIRATLEPAVVHVDETAVLSIEVEASGFGFGGVHPEFELDNLEIVAGPQRAAELRTINGRFTRRTRFVWDVRARQAGSAAVRGLRVAVGEVVAEIGELRIEVRAGPAPAPPPGGAWPGTGSPPQPAAPRRGFRDPLRRSAPAVFLRAELDPPEPWVGQQALYTVWLYTQGDVGAIEPLEVPQFRGLWAQEIPQPRSLRPEWVEAEGERFGRVALMQKAVFALAPGTYGIEPYAARLSVQVARLTLFGPLLSQVETLERASESLTLVARPLPAPPPEFFGAVGRLALDARLTPGEVEVGRAATLTVTLSGAGHLEGLPDPRLPALPRVAVYPPHQDSREEVKGDSVRGRRTWSFVLVPQRSGSWNVPPVEVTYFDPIAGEYRVARSASLALTAVGTGSPALTQRQEELHPLRSAALPLPLPATRRLDGVLPLLFALPWGAATLLLAARRLSSSGGAAARARRGLRQALEEAAREPRPRHAAARIEDAWRAFLGDRWRLPPGAPANAWPEVLLRQGAEPAATQELVRLADDLHYLRYAPQLSATETVCREVVDRSLRLARRLR